MLRIKLGSIDRIESPEIDPHNMAIDFWWDEKQFSGKWIIFSTNGAGRIVHPYAKKGKLLTQQFTLSDCALNVKCETIKFLERNHKRNSSVPEVRQNIRYDTMIHKRKKISGVHQN